LIKTFNLASSSSKEEISSKKILYEVFKIVNFNNRYGHAKRYRTSIFTKVN
jgi:hypothetical protein